MPTLCTIAQDTGNFAMWYHQIVLDTLSTTCAGVELCFLECSFTDTTLIFGSILTTNCTSLPLLTLGSMVTFLPCTCFTLLTLQRHIDDLRWTLLSSHVIFCVNSDRTNFFQICLRKGPFLLSLWVVTTVILLGSEVTNRITGLVRTSGCILLLSFFLCNKIFAQLRSSLSYCGCHSYSFKLSHVVV